ncbi:NAD(P)/FAD-dependent oxidoreductase [Telmatocola sphagniphila]|uniref:NAD(P)/FAD-dependent oxidoreductase n=1 Tax=Telmatocola sphagniphila TaxID=1123043 RepID=A0A8E6B6G4_9BACT|nr:NAD(P)/FAD-dependent oxidoreductase [Telmatocola sphagniphila]QVL32169.1 NAD(P)/FAD-dependent oxidoreductase [Telmatocola sphagniphila]
MTESWDAVVIGAGAAGLMAAIAASERGRRILVLEKNRKPGVKILMSGGTRCNITHDCENRDIVKAFGPNGSFLHAPLAHFGVREVIQFFQGEGVATKVEDTGKIFPVSNKAADVLEALVKRVQRVGAQLALEESVTELKKDSLGFEIVTTRRTMQIPKVLLTTGGQSYPGCGTRGEGFAFVSQLGHTIVPPKPALVPIQVQADWVGELRGITLPDVSLKVLENGKTLSSRRSGFLMAHFGLTGPAPLDVSKSISRHPQPGSLLLEIDFLPAMSENQFDEFLQKESLASGKKQLAVVLSELLPRRLADMSLLQTGLQVDRKAAGLSKADRLKLVQWIKKLRIPIRGTLGFEKAEVTTGGVNLKEVDSRDMQSKIVPGLYLAGEILDLDGPIGGYNFQSAWSTGHLAGANL